MFDPSIPDFNPAIQSTDFYLHAQWKLPLYLLLLHMASFYVCSEDRLVYNKHYGRVFARIWLYGTDYTHEQD